MYAWENDSRCGTGFTIRAEDGQVLDLLPHVYKYPQIVAGEMLTAGQPVGSSATPATPPVPYFHLQLQPAASYPQEQDWFERFAGTAFQWSDGTPTKAGSPVGGRSRFDLVQAPTD